ncbi:thioredoxin domain-containing protein [Mariniluteicoccus endophyticus]
MLGPSSSSPFAPEPKPGNGLARLGWIAAWALSVVLAFVLGMQSRPTTAPTAAPADGVPAETAAAAPTAKPSQDPQVTQLLKSLPKRDPNDMAALGKVDAPVVLIEWSDYRCPFCAVWAKRTLPELQKYVDDGTLRIEYRDLPLFGEQSVNTAIAVRAAGRQGKFWEYYHAVFDAAPQSGHPNIGPAEIENFARAAGVPDMAKFKADLADPELRKIVESEGAHGQQLGISGTPFFVVNTQILNGAQPTQNFVQAIETAKRGG